MDFSDHNLTVIAVDDCRIAHKLSKKYLQKLGLNAVSSFTDAEEAVAHIIDLAQNKSLTICLLVDINMPAINGFEFVQRLQEQGVENVVKVAISAEDAENGPNKEEFASCQFDGIIRKPYDFETFSKVITQTLNKLPLKKAS